MRTLLLWSVSSVLLWSAAKPDFSGEWKLNLSKSDFGKSPAPRSVVSHIQHHEPKLTVESEIAGPAGVYTTKYEWVTDGSEVVNTIRGTEIKATVVWKREELVSNAQAVVDGISLKIIDRWQLSRDEKQLTVSRTIVAPQGNAEQVFVYERP